MPPATFNYRLELLSRAIQHWDEHPLSNSAKRWVQECSYILFGVPIEEVLE